MQAKIICPKCDSNTRMTQQGDRFTCPVCGKSATNIEEMEGATMSSTIPIMPIVVVMIIGVILLFIVLPLTMIP